MAPVEVVAAGRIAGRAHPEQQGRKRGPVLSKFEPAHEGATGFAPCPGVSHLNLRVLLRMQDLMECESSLFSVRLVRLVRLVRPFSENDY
jgi:hypothetical protein